MSLVYGFFFVLFPWVKKVRVAAASPSVELPREVSSWTPAVYGETIGSDDVGEDSRGRQDPLLEPTHQRDLLEPS